MLIARFFLGLALVLCAGSGAARAHALVLRSEPAPDAVIDSDATPVEIRFSSRIDAARSHLRLFRIDGPAVDLTIVDSAAPDALTARAAGLTPGAYRLHWQTLSPDGHITQGDIPFTVRR
jgi:methionine-rich copper-binding protein CopC